MCGIAGFLGTFDQSLLPRMHELLRHRGPDDKGFFFSGDHGVGLAHARLSIIDVEGGRQPLVAKHGRLQVIFNGEIYNHAELRRDLKRRGHEFRTHSDGEVIGPLYIEHGVEFVHQLRGMFAIAIWDQDNGRLILVRDRLGIKPLYYRQTSQGFMFASESKALQVTEHVDDLDFQGLNWYLSFRYVPEDRTLLRGIRKLRPGHIAVIEPNRMTVSRYWSLRDARQQPARSEKAWAEELRGRLEEAIAIRLMSEVPLGAFLSGGLDSSFIVGLMASMIDRPVKTFSFGVGDGWHNESQFAELAARAFGTEHYPLSGPLDSASLIQKVAWHLDEPLGDTAVLPTFLLSQLTKEHVTVVLTGEGADELLGGYDKYKILSLGDRFSHFAPTSLLGPFSRLAILPVSGRRAFKYLSSLRQRARAYMSLVGVFDDDEKRRMLTPDVYNAVIRTEPAEEVIQRILAEGDEDGNYFDELMHIDVETWLPNDVLLKADKMSMAHGLEARVPFLDHKFAEFCVSIPPALKLKGRQEKYILRRAMQGVVPRELSIRRKHGFTVPLENWLHDVPSGPVQAFLGSSALERTGIISRQGIFSLLQTGQFNEFRRRQLITAMMCQASLIANSPDARLGAFHA